MLRLASATMMRAIRAVSVERGPRPAAVRDAGVRRQRPAVRRRHRRRTRHRTHHHPAIARRIQRLRPTGGRCRTPWPPEHPRPAGRRRSRAHRRNRRRPDRSGHATTAGRRIWPERQIFQRAASARYAGQSSEIEVALPAGTITPALIAAAFAEEHEKTYGFRAPNQEPVELIGLSVMARGLPEQPRLPARIPPFAQRVPATRRAWFPAQGWVGHAGHRPRRTDRDDPPGPLIIQGIRRDLPGSEWHDRPRRRPSATSGWRRVSAWSAYLRPAADPSTRVEVGVDAAGDFAADAGGCLQVGQSGHLHPTRRPEMIEQRPLT